MREGKASTTAIFVAWARGLGTSVHEPDALAPEVLPAPLALHLRATKRWPLAAAPIRWLARAATVGLVDHIALRTAAIDAALRGAVDSGIDRLVLLGAGLDGRAWRLPWLRDVDVLEVDHPDTQALKRERTASLPPLSRSVRFVPVDFERERLGDRLDAGGHEANRRTFWIWEGVTPYLEPEAIEATLRDIADRSASGSLLAMTYATPEITPVPLPGLRTIVPLGFRTLGEPLRGLATPEQTQARLRRFGFTVLTDTDQPQWSAGRRLEPALAIAYRAERLAIAKRMGGAA
jgi:methyltransferase (TIGR00027 family)